MYEILNLTKQLLVTMEDRTGLVLPSRHSSIGPGFKPQQCLLAGMWKIGLAAKRSAGVTLEVNLRERVTHMPLPSANKTAYSGFETQRRHHQKSSKLFCKKKKKGWPNFTSSFLEHKK